MNVSTVRRSIIGDFLPAWLTIYAMTFLFLSVAGGCGCNDGWGGGGALVQDGGLPEAAITDSGGMSERGWLSWPDAGPDGEVDSEPNPNIIVFPEEGDYETIGFTNQGTIITFPIHDEVDPVHKTDVYNIDTDAHTRITDTLWSEIRAHINQDYFLYISDEDCSHQTQKRLVLMNRHTREETILLCFFVLLFHDILK